jgi:two-component system, NtrC family, response regulator AtoC
VSELAHARILVVDDDPKLVDILQKHLTRLGYFVDTALGGAEALAQVEAGHVPDVVLSDVRMPGLDGRSLLAELRRRAPGTRVVLMTAFAGVPDAVGAMAEGAFWYLTKPFKVEEAALVLHRAVSEAVMGRRIEQLERSLREEFRPERYLGRSERAEAVRRDLVRAAELRTAVLLQGGTGTGKELVARILHAASTRARGAFVPVNCSAIPETLFESELFGHRKGAFTGATHDSRGLAEEADGGVLFLDEIGDLPLSQQPKLLRLLEESEIRRVGDRVPRKIEVRVVAATHQPLDEMVREGRFRADLFYRLSSLVIRLPSLAERPADIPVLAESLLVDCARSAGVRAKGFTPAALERLALHAWPGNVRELRNAIEQALFRARGPTIDAADIPDWVVGGPTPDAQRATRPSPQATLDEVERAHVEQVLASTAWNRSLAAQMLGIDRRTLFTRIQRYGLVGPHRTPEDEDER